MTPTDRVSGPLGALLIAQGAHSLEEYLGRLWESFPPAAFLSGLVSSDRELGFIVANVALLTFGVWCMSWPVRKEWPSAPAFAWFWVLLEIINGIVHPLWSWRQGAYTPGVFTAPILLVLAARLAVRLRRIPRRASPAA